MDSFTVTDVILALDAFRMNSPESIDGQRRFTEAHITIEKGSLKFELKELSSIAKIETTLTVEKTNP